MIKFKTIRSKVSKIFTETQQMKIVVFLSSIYWFCRKYFLGVEINYPNEFLENWNSVKKNSSLDKERNFTIYQLINFHNQIFENKETNIIEFGVSMGSSLTTICKFCKKNSKIFGIDSFGYYADEIKKYSTSDFDKNYQGKDVAFNNRTRFSNFSMDQLTENLNNITNSKKIDINLIKCHFPKIINETDLQIISDRKYSFVYIDFDLYQSTYDALKFIFPRLEKMAIILIDDYNFINQEGCKIAVNEFGLNLSKTYQTQSGQLIYINT
tara:strand:- start:420 stop:1223 length:804 start_codon:yes stop_codon:yes gene_type:complete